MQFFWVFLGETFRRERDFRVHDLPMVCPQTYSFWAMLDPYSISEDLAAMGSPFLLLIVGRSHAKLRLLRRSLHLNCHFFYQLWFLAAPWFSCQDVW
jgi:hypothetical protein